MKKIIAFILALSFAFAPLCLTAGALSVSAASAVLMDKTTGTLMFSLNPYLKRGMASTTKIMTAVVVLENADLKREYTVNEKSALTEGSSLGLKKGDKITIGNLLYGLMLVSGNDAANALAYAVCGNMKDFVVLMNKKAAQLGMKDTHFTNPSGLPDKKHYSTAYDMAVLARCALSDSRFVKICSSKSAVIKFSVPEKRVEVYNHNRLLSAYSGCIGLKTGYTERAGRCLVSAANREGAVLIAVTLGDPDDWSDHEKMLDYGFSKLKKVEFSAENTVLRVVGGDSDSVKINTSKKVCVYVPESEFKETTITFNAPHFTYAPVSRGEQIGTISVVCRGKTLDSAKVTAAQSVKRKIIKKGFFRKIIDFLRGR